MARTAHSESNPVPRFGYTALVLCLVAIFTNDVRTQTANDVTYVYDGLGRLVGVVAPTGEATVYTYDAAGNISSIARRSSSAASVIGFTPHVGAIGTQVTIYGTGFSNTPSQNVVRFNGVEAVVTSATATTIVTSVPGGASSGTIELTTPTGTVTSNTPFVIDDSGTLTITGFSPTIGTANTLVSITGTGFEEIPPSANKVSFNGTRSTGSAATATTIATSVPTGAKSGRISVTTPLGTAVSSDDFFVPPYPFTANDIEVTGRMDFEETKTVTLGTANKVAMIVFDGTAMQRMTMRITDVTIGNSYVTVYRPGGSQLTAFSVSKGQPRFVDTLLLSDTGTYTILIDPQGTDAGSMTLSLHGVPPDFTGPIMMDGSSVTVTTTVAGQNGKLNFSATAGQRMTMRITDVTIGNSYVTVYRPGGSQLTAFSVSRGQPRFVDTLNLDLTGTYTILIDPQGTDAGSMTLSLHGVPPDFTGPIMVDGPPVVVTTTVAGQNGEVTFTAAAGQRMTMRITDVTIGNSYVTVYRPGGSQLTAFSVSRGQPRFIDTLLLSDTGTYTILIDPQGTDAGSMTLSLHGVPPDFTGPIMMDGPPVVVTTTVAGQNGEVTFTAAAGQRVTLRLTDVTIGNSYVTVYRPGGSQLTAFSVSSSGRTINLPALDASGTHRIFIDPQGTDLGSVTVVLTTQVASILTAEQQIAVQATGSFKPKLFNFEQGLKR